MGTRFQQFIVPDDAIFLNDIFDVLIFAAQCFDLYFQRDICFESDIEQQQLVDAVGGLWGCGNGRNDDDRAVILATLADIDIALADNNSFGPLQTVISFHPRGQLFEHAFFAHNFDGGFVRGFAEHVQPADTVQDRAMDGIHDPLKVFQHDDITVDQLCVENVVVGEGFEEDALGLFTDPAGAHGDCFGLVLDGIHRSGHAVDGSAEKFEQAVEHIQSRSLFAEVQFKIRHRQASGKIFEQQQQVGRVADGGGQAAGGLPLAELLIEPGDFFTECLFQNDFVNIQSVICKPVDGLVDFLPELVEKLRSAVDPQSGMVAPQVPGQCVEHWRQMGGHGRNVKDVFGVRGEARFARIGNDHRGRLVAP